MKLEEVSQVSIGILTSREVTEIGENEYKLFNLKNYDNQEEYEDVKDVNNSIELKKMNEMIKNE